MLPLSQQTTSLELSKELAKLDVNYDSQFVWINKNKEYTVVLYEPYLIIDEIEFVQAFTSQELGEILKEHDLCYWYDVNEDKWCLSRAGINKPDASHKNEAEARGLMLKYLIKNKIITIK